MTQRDLLRQALQLAEQEPDAEIHVLAYYDEILPEYEWTGHEITKVKLGWWCEYDEQIITEPDEMRERLEEDYGREFSEDEALSHMRIAVLIYTRAG